MLKRLLTWLDERPRRRVALAAVPITIVLGVYGVVQVLGGPTQITDPRNQTFMQWFTGDQQTRRALIATQHEACPGAPFILPAEGYIGLLYGDPRGPYSTADRHQGIDIFSPGDPGETPVYAAYDGYLTRETDWRSSLIIRVPDDPLNPGRQIWLYYTHMASRDGSASYIVDVFPPGTRDVFVEQGTLLGYTGDYNGGSLRSVAVHLHFSIVLDDGRGGYTNELEFDNTIDPSRYLGMPVNYGCAPDVPTCSPDPLCAGAILSGAGG